MYSFMVEFVRVTIVVQSTAHRYLTTLVLESPLEADIIEVLRYNPEGRVFDSR
jgi:hypothetical protein